MKLGIRTKLALVWLAVVIGAALVAELYLSVRLDHLLTDRVREDLFLRLALCEREASSRTDRIGWDRLAHDLGHRAAARITFVARDGAVLGDSEISAPRLREVENHLARPEVQQALASGRGSSVRHSATLGQRMMYAAVPLGRNLGAVRIAVPLTQVDQTISHLRGILLTAAVLMLAAALVMSSAGAHWISLSLRRLTETARRMASGNLTVRSRVTGHDEVARLGQALDKLAQNLAQSLSALHDERDLLDRILNGMHEGVLLLDTDGRVLLVNPALRDMLLLKADVVGQPLLDVTRHGPLKELIDRARAEPSEASEEIVIEGLKPRRLLVHASRLPGEPGSLLAVLVDVTELRRLESVRRDFVANASHELRTPIAAIRSAAETLPEVARDEPEAAPGFIEIIQRNSERLQRLVDDLLDISRIESHEFRLAPEPLLLAAEVPRTLALFADRAEQRQLRLRSAVADELPAVTADRRALEQVLANLLDNAIKYCSEGAEVRVTARDERAAVYLAVEDTGPGIEQSHLPRLFERFYRVDAGRSRELGGTGLGLSIVKHLVEAMGGTVTVESAPGKGSRFEVSLPRAGH